MTKPELNRERLLNMARALREASPRAFSAACEPGQEPAPLGIDGAEPQAHRRLRRRFPKSLLELYAVRQDLQQEFAFNGRGVIRCPGNHMVGYDSTQVFDHFGLWRHQAEELFGARACGSAKTASQAAAYIEAFVARNGR